MLLLQILSVYFMHGFCHHVVTGGQSNWGQQFVIPFLSNFEKKGSIFIKIMAKVTTSVYVDIPWESRTDSFTVLSYSEHIVQLQWNNRYEENLAVVKKAIFINATEPITVYSHSYVGNSGSGFLALPVNVLGDHYIAVSYTKANFNTSVIVAAVEDATEVVIQYNTHGGVCGPDDYTTGDTSVHTLDRLDVIGVHCTEDLTGTSVTSNRPITVVSGNVGGKVPVSANGKDAMEEMLIPVKDFGFEYVLTNAGRPESSINRIVALADNTTVCSSTGDVYHLNASNFIDIDTATHGEQCINSCAPVMVVAFGKGISETSDRQGDPSMAVIPSTRRFSNDYFIASGLGQGISSYIGSEFLTVVASLDNIGTLETMLSASHVPVSNSTYGVIHTQITTWPLQLLTDNTTIFGATLYSVSSRYRGVAFPLGMVLEPQMCWSSSCLNNGICHEINDSFVCECAFGFSGDTCQLQSGTSTLTSGSPDSSFFSSESTEARNAATGLQTSSTNVYATTSISETESQTLTTSEMSHFSPLLSTSSIDEGIYSASANTIPVTLNLDKTSTSTILQDTFFTVMPQIAISTSPIQHATDSGLDMISTTLSVDEASQETILLDQISTVLPQVPSSVPTIPIQKDVSHSIAAIVTALGTDFTAGEIRASLSLQGNSVKVSTSSVCVCLCKGTRLEILDEQSVKDVTEEIKGELVLDTKTLSKTVRKYISAPDERQSAQSVGTLGIVLLAFTFGLMIIPDVLSCCKALHRVFKR
ncbi:serine-rich adhesin for platelets-like [Haliotis asinina]|uniref:serine-rich adhesin for platelets-like n=1 Tax=Haliotis asinina TaxID=109174 RepID=UPI00353185BD